MNAYTEHFRERLLFDLLSEATSAQWHQRAATFEAAKPRKSDYLGAGGREHAEAIARRCEAAAQACRHRATLGLQPGDAAAVRVVLDEVMSGG